MKDYLIQKLVLDPLENNANEAARYETIGVTNDPVVRVTVESSPKVNPDECWALRSEVLWPRPILRFRLVEIPSIANVEQLFELIGT